MRDGWVCQYCRGHATVIDHVIEYLDGPDNTDGNLVASCVTCNVIAQNYMFDSFTDKKRYILTHLLARKGRRRSGLPYQNNCIDRLTDLHIELENL
jgi:5-methylcytosine-specific restriction endonuclease McrA